MSEILTLKLGDCREVMATLAQCSIDAIVTDPPYDLTAGKKGGTGEASVNLESPYGRARITTGFMGKQWDGTGVAFDVATWEAAYRVLKPGAHLVAFGAPRTYHRMACAIEDAGFEIRDSLMWLFGSGFPKSLDVSKALDKNEGHWRGRASGVASQNGAMSSPNYKRTEKGNPITDLARQWEGWGTALKPAFEPIVLARKPLTGTVAANVGAWGTGAMNIDGCRIEGAPGDGHWSGDDGSDATSKPGYDSGFTTGGHRAAGRWPANVLLDDDAAAQLDAMSGATGAFAPVKGTEPTADGFSGHIYGTQKGRQAATFYGDTGGASRFFYNAKTSKAEREFGLDDLEPARRHDAETRDGEAPGSNNPRLRVSERRNDHPTVKPVNLMRWLCRLITPPGGLILDPFLGSGSTGMAALDEGFRFIGIDLEPHYIEIARRRIARRHALEPLPQRDEGQGVLL